MAHLQDLVKGSGDCGDCEAGACSLAQKTNTAEGKHQTHGGAMHSERRGNLLQPKYESAHPSKK